MRRRSRRLRGGRGRGRHGVFRLPDHNAFRNHRPNVLQSGRRRIGQGTPRPGNRRLGRIDGTSGRCNRHPFPAAQPEPGRGCPSPPCPVRQIPLPGSDEGTVGKNPRLEPLSGDRRRAGYRRVPDSRRRLRRRPVDRGRGRHPHARHVPQRTHPCRAGLLSRRPGQRASIRRAGGRGSEGGIENIPLEDGDADAAGREDDRLVGFRGSARRRRTGPDVAEDGDAARKQSRLLSRLYQREDSCRDPARSRQVAALRRTDQRPGAAVLPVDRGQGRQVRTSSPPPVLSRAGRAGDVRDLRQRSFLQPPLRNAARHSPDNPRINGGGDSPSGLRRRIRRRFPDPAEADAGVSSRRGIVSGRPDQRDFGV